MLVIDELSANHLAHETYLELLHIEMEALSPHLAKLYIKCQNTGYLPSVEKDYTDMIAKLRAQGYLTDHSVLVKKARKLASLSDSERTLEIKKHKEVISTLINLF